MLDASDENTKIQKWPEEESAPKLGSNLLVVFDMDRTMVLNPKP